MGGRPVELIQVVRVLLSQTHLANLGPRGIVGKQITLTRAPDISLEP